jgi:hypothetical protein
MFGLRQNLVRLCALNRGKIPPITQPGRAWHILLLLLFLFACGKQSQWAFDQIHSKRQEFRSTKLTYRSHDPVNGIEIQFLKTEEHLNVYLNIHSIPITPYQGDPKKALLTLEIESQAIRTLAYRFTGGQRFLLSEETAQILIEALKNKKEVTVSLIGYRTILKPEDFASKFEQLLHPFPFQNPFHLPLLF